jgi:hypothetical protein
VKFRSGIILSLFIAFIDCVMFLYYINIPLFTIQYNTIYFIPIKVPQGAITNKYAFIIISKVTTIQNGDICSFSV